MIRGAFLRLATRVSQHEPLWNALSMLMLLWLYGSMVLLAFYGLLGAGKWWMTAVAVIVGFLSHLTNTAFMLFKQAQETDDGRGVVFRQEHDYVSVEATVRGRVPTMPDVAGHDIGVSLDEEVGLTKIEIALTRVGRAHDITPDGHAWKLLQIAQEEGRETRAHRLVYLVSYAIGAAVFVREGISGRDHLRDALRNILTEVAMWLQDIRQRELAEQKKPS